MLFSCFFFLFACRPRRGGLRHLLTTAKGILSTWILLLDKYWDKAFASSSVRCRRFWRGCWLGVWWSYSSMIKSESAQAKNAFGFAPQYPPSFRSPSTVLPSSLWLSTE